MDEFLLIQRFSVNLQRKIEITIMETILSTSYPVHFEKTAYKAFNEYLQEHDFKKIFVLVDENTHEHCLPIFQEHVKAAVEFEIIEIVSGEAEKNMETCIGLWNVLTELGADRKSLLVNIGGGVITDMGGFVATCYKRGIRFINIPTTLLSMVDASVGGKTGVDLGVLKNQVGVFADPQMVIIDPAYLATVPQREVVSGMAEIIKYGLTYDQSLWLPFLDFDNIDLKSLIHRSIEIKNEVVLQDRLETSLRKILNFGHTIGHAVESYFLESEDKENITHGEAIALGMIVETYISTKLFNFPTDTLALIKETIFKIFGKIEFSESDFPAIVDLMKHDKKNVNGEVNFVLIEDLEKYKIDCKVSIELIEEALKDYLAS